MPRFRLPLLWAVASSIAGCASVAAAQSGRISGTVRNENGSSLAGARVVAGPSGLVATSGPDGQFVFAELAPGVYWLKASLPGFAPDSMAAGVRANETTVVSIRLLPAIAKLQAVVMSVSRRAERITSAPATVSVFSATDVENRMGGSYLPVLREAVGLTATQTGVTGIAVNARGFNRLFNTRWLTLEDGRIASLPETALPVGEHTTISKLDVASVEFVVGPGSALYGANAASGVLSVRTKDPRAHPGLSVEVSAGTRDFYDAQIRYAGARGRWGYKLTGGYQSAHEWTDPLFYCVGTTSPTCAGGTTVPEKTPWNPHVQRANGSLSYYLAGGSRFRFNIGASRRTGLRELAAGRQRILNHGYEHYQLEFASGRWFANAYVTHSNTGDTYFLFTEAQRGSNPNLSRDSVRSLSSFRLDGRMHVAEVQNNFVPGTLRRTGFSPLDDARVVWGGQLRRDRVSSYNLLYVDRVTLRPIYLDTPSGYAQIESPLGRYWRLVLAGRYDNPNIFESQLSPKVGVLFSPAPDQTFRLTYNKAYSAPGTRESQTFNGRALAAGQTLVSAIDGLIVRNASGDVVNTIAPIHPEGNRTWEAGYKGVLGRRLFVDATTYRSAVDDFITNAVLIANPTATQGPLAGTRAYNARTGILVANASGTPLTALTYLNAGSAVVFGLDAVVRYNFSDRVSLRSSASVAKVDTIEIVASAPDASLYNSSSAAFSTALELTDLPHNTKGTATLRHVNGYDFRSGVARGRIPTHTTLDLSATRRLGSRGLTVMLQVQNLASCVSGETTYPASGVVTGGQLTYTRKHRCGFGVRHREMLFMPPVGTMVFVGARRDWR